MRNNSTLDRIWDDAVRVGKSSSKSWMGYHANVYYADFTSPPVGSEFDGRYGIRVPINNRGSHWIEHDSTKLVDTLIGDGKAALEELQQLEEEGRAIFSGVKDDVGSIVTVYLLDHKDSYVEKFKEDLDNIKVLDAIAILNAKSPKGQIVTYDEKAAMQGTRPPPHEKVMAWINSAHQPSAHCRELALKVKKLASHISRVNRQDAQISRVGTNVFIGHGRSHAWRDLKDYIRDRLRLPYDEFNRVPVAGITNIARLSEMLESAACAFIIMTAEDEAADGKVQARMNVIHEVGLFQGRLGFTKAIVLLEQGCEEFSNIQGLGQIRFPAGNITAVFDQIRQVLEREGLIEGPGEMI